MRRSARVIPPPLIFAFALLIAAVATGLAPAPILARTAVARAIGAAFTVSGAALSTWMVIHFRRADTPVSPLAPTRRLVTTGPYRFSRNPDYIGQSLLYLGLGFLLNCVWILAAFVPAVLIVRYHTISREERYLRTLFGREYESYARCVRRWL